jgi:hypothetical protein
MEVPAALVICASALSAMLSAQIPKDAEWEITFAQVEAAAGLSDMQTAPPDTFEARLMQRAGVGFAPVPFLRLVRTEGTVRAQLFRFWKPGYLDPSHRPQGADIVCRDEVCVKPVALHERRDWRQAVASLAETACPTEPRSNVVIPATGGVSSSVKVCPHCPVIWIKTAVDGKYREQVCNEPGPETEAGALLELMKRSARAGR